MTHLEPKKNKNITHFLLLTLFRMGFFGAPRVWGEGFWLPLPKICHTYLTMMKLGTVIPYLRKIQKICKSRDRPLISGDVSIFHRKSANFAISRNTDMYWILIHNF